MAGFTEELTRMIEKLGQQPPDIMLGTVVEGSVDIDKGVCSVLISKSVFKNVSLQSTIANGSNDGIYIIPSDGSYVAIGRKNSGINFFIVSFTSVETVALKGDKFGGLVKIEYLLDRLNKIEGKLNSLISRYNSHSHSANGLATISTVVGNSGTTNRGDLENIKITHGDN